MPSAVEAFGNTSTHASMFHDSDLHMCQFTKNDTCVTVHVQIKQPFVHSGICQWNAPTVTTMPPFSKMDSLVDLCQEPPAMKGADEDEGVETDLFRGLFDDSADEGSQHGGDVEAVPKCLKASPSKSVQSDGRSKASSRSCDGESSERLDYAFGAVKPPCDPLTKVCGGCDAPATLLTMMDEIAESSFRSWALANYWGALCLWCGRMMRVRYAFMKMPMLTKWLEQLENKAQFKACSVAYVSLREEGRIHLTADHIDRRVHMLRKYCHMMGESVDEMRFFQTVPISDCLKMANPVTLQLQLVQMSIDGRKRLGFKVPTAKASKALALPPNVVGCDGIATDEPADLELLQDFSVKAEGVAALGGLAESPPVKVEQPQLNALKKQPGNDDGVKQEPGVDGDEDCADDDRLGGDVRPERVFPKGKASAAVKKMFCRLDSVFLNFCASTWRDAVTDASVRSNIRAVLEHAVSLETSEHGDLIEYNREQKKLWLAIQTVLKALRKAKDVSAEVLLPIYDDFVYLRSAICTSSRPWFCMLEKYFIHCAFLHHFENKDLAAAVEFLDLENPMSHLQKVYSAVSKLTADAKDDKLEHVGLCEWVWASAAASPVFMHERTSCET